MRKLSSIRSNSSRSSIEYPTIWIKWKAVIKTSTIYNLTSDYILSSIIYLKMT